MKKHILVTGGTGYIGSHMVVRLIEAGMEPIIFDNFSNSKPAVVDRIEMITGKRPTLVRGDIRDEKALEKLFTDYPIDAVINFAGRKAVGESEADPLLYFSYNVEGTIVLLRVMKKFGVKEFVFSSLTLKLRFLVGLSTDVREVSALVCGHGRLRQSLQ